MQIREVYQILDKLSPFELQEKWDNSGLQVGSMNDEVQRVYLSLDIDSSLIDKVEEKSLIITHHPLIFKGIRSVDSSYYPSNIIKKMIKKDISLISMHTNFDKTHLNKYVATKVLGYENATCSDDFICYFDVGLDFSEFILHVKKSLKIDTIRVVGEEKKINRCALTTGSGGDLISYVDADCYLSGDFKYHQALEAYENKLNLIDIGHFESESYFSVCLSENLKNFPLKVIITNSINPFLYK
ncbi:Nif3-like dinuclear metal center hexameric protein [Sulfurospirillum sp. 1307]|jgi:dinuclear metal center YbgI/SA1388 family protein